MVSRPIGNTLSRGFEFDANWRVGGGLTALFGYGRLNSQITNAGVDREVVGRPTTGTPRENSYVALRYAFQQQPLRGLSATAGVTYTGDSRPFSEAGGITTNGLILTHNGQRDIVISCETREIVSGLVWLSHLRPGQVENLSYLVHEISGTSPKGLKFDRVELIDLDADGDLDVLTTEERSLWGVVWFENPAK